MASTVQIRSQLEVSYPWDRLGTLIPFSGSLLLSETILSSLRHLHEFAPGTQAEGESLLVSMQPLTP